MRLDEFEAFVGEADVEGEGCALLKGEASVYRDLRCAVFVGALDCEGAVLVEDEGAVAEGVWADGGHDKHACVGVHDGTVCGEVVGSGAGGCGEDKSVTIVGGDVFLSGVDFERDESRDGVVFDDDVVECVAVLSVRSAATEQRAFVNAVFAFKYAEECFLDALVVVGSEEAEFAVVDSQEGDVV